MRKPAKKYFKPSFGSRSIMQMRTWMDAGATAADMVRWIKSEYAKASDDREREHLGYMLAAAMSVSGSFSARIVAGKCAALFGIPMVEGRNMGENAMLMMQAYDDFRPFEWPQSFNPYFVKDCPLPSASAPKGIVTKALSLADHRCLVTVSAPHSVYFMRDAAGYAWLIAVNRCNTDILVDEETFHCDPPLYFTESTHFISPVWIVTQVAAVLEHILKEIGYPPMTIYRRVIFEEPGAHLINEEAYLDCKEWKGVDVVTLHKTDGKVFPAPAIPLVDIDRKGGECEQDMDVRLYLSLLATSKVLEVLHIERHWEVTKAMIEEWCRKSCIFPPADWSAIYRHESDDEDDSIF